MTEAMTGSILSARDTLCIFKWNYPVVDFGKRAVRTCCRSSAQHISGHELAQYQTDVFLNTPYQLRRRLEMLKGLPHPDCGTCRLLEENGIKSPREFKLPQGWKSAGTDSDTDEHLTAETPLYDSAGHTTRAVDIKPPLERSGLLRSDQPFMLEINLGSHCDMQCTYCGPNASQQWLYRDTDIWAVGNLPKAFNEQEAASLKHELKDNFDDNFWELFWQWFEQARPTLYRLGILGGEPLIHPRFYDFLKRLLRTMQSIPEGKKPAFGFYESDKPVTRHKPLLYIVTNLNTPAGPWQEFKKILPLLCEHFWVEVTASMDSTGQRAEYIRQGLSWERFAGNMHDLCAQQLEDLNVGFQITISSLNITSVQQLLEFALELNNRYNRPIMLKQGIAVKPDLHNPVILPPEYSAYIGTAVEFIKKHEEQVHKSWDPHARWKAYRLWLETIAAGISAGGGHTGSLIHGDRDAARGTFYRFFSLWDQRRKKSFVETFPELIPFWQMCKAAGECAAGLSFNQ